MPLSASEIQAQIDAIEARVATFAGVRETTYEGQTTIFSFTDAQAELARLRSMLAAAQSSTGSTTRYAAVNKGFD